MSGEPKNSHMLMGGVTLRSQLPANFVLSQSHLAQSLWIYRQLFIHRFEAYAASILEMFVVVRNLVEVVPEMYDSKEVLSDVERSLALDCGSCLEYVQKAFDEFVRASQEQLVASLLDKQKANYQSSSVISRISKHLSKQFAQLSSLNEKRIGSLESVDVLQNRMKEVVANLPSVSMQPEALMPLVEYEDEEDDLKLDESPVDTTEVRNEAEEEEGMVMVTPKTSAIVEKSSKNAQPVTRHFSVDSTSLPAILEQKKVSPAWSLSATQLEIFLRSELLFKQIKHQLPSSFGVVLIDKASTKRRRAAIIMKVVQPRPDQPAAAAPNQRGARRRGYGVRPAYRVAPGFAADPVIGEELPILPEVDDERFAFGAADPYAAYDYGLVQGFEQAANWPGGQNEQGCTYHLVELDLLTGEALPLHDLPFLPRYLTQEGCCIGLASRSLNSIKIYKDNSEVYSSADNLQQPVFGHGLNYSSMNQFLLQNGAIFFMTPTNELVKYVVDKDSSFQLVIGTSRIHSFCLWQSYLVTIDATNRMTFYSTKNMTLVKRCRIPPTSKSVGKEPNPSWIYYSCISDNQLIITLSMTNRPEVATQFTSINLHTVRKTLGSRVETNSEEIVNPNSHTATLKLESFFEFAHENAASYFSNSVFFSIKGVRHLGLMAGMSNVLAIFCIEHHKIHHRGSVKIMNDADLPGMPRHSDTVVLTTLDESLVISRALKQNLIILRPEIYL